MSNEAQSAIVSYFELVFDYQHKVELGSGGGLLHPLLRKSYDVLLPGFVNQIPHDETTQRIGRDVPLIIFWPILITHDGTEK